MGPGGVLSSRPAARNEELAEAGATYSSDGFARGSAEGTLVPAPPTPHGRKTGSAHQVHHRRVTSPLPKDLSDKTGTAWRADGRAPWMLETGMKNLC